ncbi:MAG: class I SAM-dependent methyltransferase [Elusimicrobiales bacterium]|nr:class I SAM-dependent methyltransferase [Elusimicrobiales bacterium]
MTDYDERTPDCETNTHYKVMLSGYKWALSMIPGAAEKKILDCACGRGYGSFYLASAALKVDGVDISPETVAYCRARYKRQNLCFEVMDASSLRFPDRTFDAVISQDTIEHVEDDVKFLSEISRVLKDDGIFIVFTPHSAVHNNKPGNIYHLREYSPGSFLELAGRYFAKVEFYGRSLSAPLRRLEDSLGELRSADPLGLRRIVPVKARHLIASLIARMKGLKTLEEVTVDDMEYSKGLGDSPTIIAVCRKT